MRKLFRAAFYRTENKKMIRIELVIAVLLSAFIILNGYFQTNLTNAYIYKLVARFFGYSPLMGPFIAVFAAYLWGTDYEYGTLRNKLICGHTREEVYFSNLLLTICAGLSTALIWLIVNGMLGIPLLGTASLNLSLGEMAFYIFSSLLMVVALSSVCCLLASLAENKNSATLLCLGAVAAMGCSFMIVLQNQSYWMDGCGVIQTQLCDGIPKISNSSVEHFVSCWNFLSV